MKIYKYVTIKNATKILNGERMLLENPSVFNDPFDTDLRTDSDDIYKTNKILANSSYLTQLVSLISDPNIAKALKNDEAFAEIKEEYSNVMRTLRLTHRFDTNIRLPKYEKWLSLNQNIIEENAKNTSQIVVDKIKSNVLKMREQILVICFSKDPKSILMWSHYSDHHKGVCIEYERPTTNDFVDIQYSEQRPTLKTANLTSFIAAQTILGEGYNNNTDESLIKETMEPYQTKAKPWEYEQEVRCMVTTQTKHITKEENDYFYKMPKPTKIYIGCRASGKEMNRFIELAKKKNIRYVFLKKDKKTFSLLERHK